jgi:hypothetical protein
VQQSPQQSPRQQNQYAVQQSPQQSPRQQNQYAAQQSQQQQYTAQQSLLLQKQQQPSKQQQENLESQQQYTAQQSLLLQKQQQPSKQQQENLESDTILADEVIIQTKESDTILATDNHQHAAQHQYSVQQQRYAIQPYKLQQLLQTNKLQQSAVQKGLKFIAKGGLGCVFSPPLLFNDIVTQDYPVSSFLDKKFDINNLDKNYIGKILSCSKYYYRKELNGYLRVQTIDKESKYTPKLIFAGYMNRLDLISFIQSDLHNIKNNTDLIDTYTCILNKLNTNYKNYGYIISTNVGKSFDKIMKSEIDMSRLIIILQSLNEGIDKFIKQLYNKTYLHGDLKLKNITLKDNRVYFIDFGSMHKYKNYEDNYMFSMNYNYPIILKSFYNIKEMKKEKNILEINKNELITSMKNEFNKIINDNELIYNLLLSFFKYPETINQYIESYLNILFENISNEYQLYSIDSIYENYILPIAKNCDIYALSVFIYEIFYGHILGKTLVNRKTKKLVLSLYHDALYNQIDGPGELSKRLENIIKSIQI